MAKEIKGTTWPWLITAVTFVVTSVLGVFWKGNMDKIETFKARSSAATAAIDKAQKGHADIVTELVAYETFLGTSKSPDVYPVKTGISMPAVESFDGEDEKSAAYKAYSKGMVSRNEKVTKNFNLGAYIDGTFKQGIEEAIGYYALERKLLVGGNGSLSDVEKLSRDLDSEVDLPTQRSSWAESTEGKDALFALQNGNSPRGIMGEGYLSYSRNTLDFTTLLEANLFLVRNLANSTKAAESNLSGVVAEEKPIIDSTKKVRESDSVKTVVDNTKVILSSTDDIIGAEKGVKKNWESGANVLKEFDRFKDFDERIAESIAKNIRAVGQSKERYRRLINGTADPSLRKIGKHTRLDNTTAVDANIVWYDRAMNRCRINLGSDKNSHPGMRFEVYGRDSNNFYVRQGVIEVVSVLGVNYSMAMVIETQGNGKIASGQDLVNRIWEDGAYLPTGLLGELWGGEHTRYTRAEVLAKLKNLGVPAENIPNVNSRIIVVGKDPDSDTLLPDSERKMLRGSSSIAKKKNELKFPGLDIVELKVSEVLVYLEPR